MHLTSWCCRFIPYVIGWVFDQDVLWISLNQCVQPSDPTDQMSAIGLVCKLDPERKVGPRVWSSMEPEHESTHGCNPAHQPSPMCQPDTGIWSQIWLSSSPALWHWPHCALAQSSLQDHASWPLRLPTGSKIWQGSDYYNHDYSPADKFPACKPEVDTWYLREPAPPQAGQPGLPILAGWNFRSCPGPLRSPPSP